MKKLLTVLAIVLVAFFAFANGSTESAQANKYNTVTPGKLTVATSPDFAPYEFYSLDKDGNPTLAGFDISLAKHLAKELGLELEIIPMDFDGTLAELANGTVDISLAGYSPSEDRKEVMEFSSVYFRGGQSFVTLKQNANKYNELSKLNNKKMSVGAQIGSIQIGLAEKYSASADLVKLSKVPDICAEIMAGTLDGGYIETLVAQSYIDNYPQLAIACAIPYDAEGSVVGVKKGNKVLCDAISKIVDKIVADGTMAKFVEEAVHLANGSVYEGLLKDKK